MGNNFLTSCAPEDEQLWLERPSKVVSEKVEKEEAKEEGKSKDEEVMAGSYEHLGIEKKKCQPPKSCRKFSAPVYQKSPLTLEPYDIVDDIKAVFKTKAKPSPQKESTQKESTQQVIFKSITFDDYELHFYRDEVQIRESYLAKLIYKKIWSPNHKQKINNNLFIFDWDDTLLCTSFLTCHPLFINYQILDRKTKEKFLKLEGLIIRLLKRCLEKGDVYIITNAEPGWVEYSTEKYYPNLVPLLKKLKIISARGRYEHIYPKNSKAWKYHSFLDIMKHFNHELITNIICLGDSLIEIEAGNLLGSRISQAYVKTIKFKEYPKPEELIKQLSLISDQFNEIYSAVRNLTICVERRKNKTM